MSVYFIRAGGGPVKIGVADDVEHRLRELLTQHVPIAGGGHVLVDDDDFPLVCRCSWRRDQRQGRVSVYAKATIGRRSVLMHRLILSAGNGEIVDHINGDGLDNRRSNLRIATPLTNQWARRKRRHFSSQYKGVHCRTNGGRWIAQIRLDGRKVWLGAFDSETEAALAYDCAAVEHHGEWAITNFPHQKIFARKQTPNHP